MWALQVKGHRPSRVSTPAFSASSLLFSCFLLPKLNFNLANSGSEGQENEGKDFFFFRPSRLEGPRGSLGLSSLRIIVSWVIESFSPVCVYLWRLVKNKLFVYVSLFFVDTTRSFVLRYRSARASSKCSGLQLVVQTAFHSPPRSKGRRSPPPAVRRTMATGASEATLNENKWKWCGYFPRVAEQSRRSLPFVDLALSFTPAWNPGSFQGDSPKLTSSSGDGE